VTGGRVDVLYHTRKGKESKVIGTKLGKIKSESIESTKEESDNL
jgi:hypothetical protein